jgi:hypothetical protein
VEKEGYTDMAYRARRHDVRREGGREGRKEGGKDGNKGGKREEGGGRTYMNWKEKLCLTASGAKK